MPGWLPRGLACDVRPFPLRIRICLPLPVNIAAVGYQPVGIKPFTVLAPGVVTSTTATLLLSALATSSVAPSGDRPNPLGVVPAGASGKSAIEICSFAVFDARSTTQTALVL